MELSTAQKNRMLAAAEIIDKGDMAVLEKILEFTDYFDQWKTEIEALKTEFNTTLSNTLQIRINELSSQMTEFSDKMTEMENDESMEEMMESKHESMMAEMQSIKDGMKSINSSLLSEIQKVRSEIPEMPESFDPTDILNRVNEIELKIPKIPEEVTAYQVRDKLESIDNESEKLDISAIKDLKKKLEDLEKKWTSRPMFGGGGYSVIAANAHIIDDETPAGTKNGANTDFTISHAPSPTNSLKVYVNGQRQRITENYTFSGVTITFVEPPLSTDIILCDFRI